MGGTAGDSPRDVDVGWGCVGCSRVPHAGSAKRRAARIDRQMR